MSIEKAFTFMTLGNNSFANNKLLMAYTKGPKPQGSNYYQTASSLGNYHVTQKYIDTQDPVMTMLATKYRNKAGLVITYDASDSLCLNDIKAWINEAKHCGSNNCPIVLLGLRKSNKSSVISDEALE